jgi:hypothetical protein
MRASWCLVLSLAACSNDDAGTTQTPCAVTEVTGTIPGVSITIESDSCLYRRGEATTASVPTIAVPDSMSCDCSHPNATIASWVSWDIAGTSAVGEPQQYCLCDTGCCAPGDPGTITPDVGTVSDTIVWPGRVWSGPSDTGNVPGDFFAVGSYAVSVRFFGFDEGSVEASLPIMIVP